jgi:hypothetical protein
MLISFLIPIFAEASIQITGLSSDQTQRLQVGDSVTFTATAMNSDGGDIYYRFDLIPNYGTDDYDPNNNWQTIQGFSTSSSCTHTFNTAGKYVVVVWASSTPNILTGAAPIIGGSVTVGDDGSVDITGLSMNITETLETGASVTFTADAISSVAADLYYRFDLIPGYGIGEYDPMNVYETIQDFSTSNTCTYTFNEANSYVLIARASPTPSILSASAPIIGGSVQVYTSDTEPAQGEIYVDIYDPEKVYAGTTLFTDIGDPQDPRIVEVNMQGEIVWQYDLPESLIAYTQPGFDVELLSTGNILVVQPGYGIYEIDRSGTTVWTHLDPKVSHDADRLPNGNTIYVFGNNDTEDDAQIKEVDSQGNLVWSWYAKNHFYESPYIGISDGGWAHTNAVTRLQNGNTLISLRNFYLTVEVNSQGSVVWSYDWTTIGGSDPDPHEPEMLANNNLLVCLQNTTPYELVQIDRTSGSSVWTYARSGLRTCRDGDRLPNGNTLIVGVLENTQDSVIFEITQDGEIVWQLKLFNRPASQTPGYFYKAQRIGSSP